MTEPGRCCCGRVVFYDVSEKCLVHNNYMHERLGGEGSFCGPVDNHTMRDQEREIERLQARVEEAVKLRDSTHAFLDMFNPHLLPEGIGRQYFAVHRGIELFDLARAHKEELEANAD